MSRLFPCLPGVSLFPELILIVIIMYQSFDPLNMLFCFLCPRSPRQTSFARSNALTQGMPSLHQAARFGRVDTRLVLPHLTKHFRYLKWRYSHFINCILDKLIFRKTAGIFDNFSGIVTKTFMGASW